METHHISVFDTTLRDGEQAPGCSMGVDDKLRMAWQLEVFSCVFALFSGTKSTRPTGLCLDPPQQGPKQGDALCSNECSGQGFHRRVFYMGSPAAVW